MSLQVSYKKQILLGVLFALVLLFSIEGIIRFQDEYFPNHCYYIGNQVFENIDQFTQSKLCKLYTELKIDHSTPIRMPVPDQHYQYINVNEFGFRGEEILKEKSLEDYRIFVVGGSTTFGYVSTSDDTTIPGFLEKKINASDLDYNIEVINAGSPASDSRDEFYYIKNTIIDFSPDLIIMYDGWNEVNDANKHKFTLSDDEFESNTYYENNPKPELKKGTGVIQALENLGYQTALRVAVFFKSFSPINEPTLEPIENKFSIQDIEKISKKNWLQVCNLGIQEKYSTAIILQPILGTSDRILSNDERDYMNSKNFDKRVYDYLRNFSLESDELKQKCRIVADLRNGFDDVSEPIFFDSGHMSDLGNEIIAEKIFDTIYPILIEDFEERKKI